MALPTSQYLSQLHVTACRSSVERVAASRNPRARSMAVRPEVMALVMVKRGAKSVMSQFSTESAVLERGEERVELGERGAVGGFQFVDGGDLANEGSLETDRRDID